MRLNFLIKMTVREFLIAQPRAKSESP